MTWDWIVVVEKTEKMQVCVRWVPRRQELVLMSLDPQG